MRASDNRNGCPCASSGISTISPRGMAPRKIPARYWSPTWKWIFEQSGGERATPRCVDQNRAGRRFRQVVDDLRECEITVMDYQAAPTRIADELRRPSGRTLACSRSVSWPRRCWTVLGFLLYALFSFRRRFIEAGHAALRWPLDQATGHLPDVRLAFLIPSSGSVRAQPSGA